VLAVTSLSELDVYQVAYLCGGPQRVAIAAVAAMAQDGRIKISRSLRPAAGHTVRKQAGRQAGPANGQEEARPGSPGSRRDESVMSQVQIEPLTGHLMIVLQTTTG
jgi:uncharacterized protein (TIGR04222 family)